jgi:TPR repeat protein
MTKWQLDDLYKRSVAHLRGEGEVYDEARAFALNSAAASKGHRDAMLAMGWFYLNGVGTTPDLEKARGWYREIARLGEARAMLRLGQIACGEQDYFEAYSWFRRAHQAGDATALYWLGKMHWRGQGGRRDLRAALDLFRQAAAKNVPEAKRALRLLKRKS